MIGGWVKSNSEDADHGKVDGLFVDVSNLWDGER